jgi:hypothetical protein
LMNDKKILDELNRFFDKINWNNQK